MFAWVKIFVIISLLFLHPKTNQLETNLKPIGNQFEIRIKESINYCSIRIIPNSCTFNTVWGILSRIRWHEIVTAWISEKCFCIPYQALNSGLIIENMIPWISGMNHNDVLSLRSISPLFIWVFYIKKRFQIQCLKTGEFCLGRYVGFVKRHKST